MRWMIFKKVNINLFSVNMSILISVVYSILIYIDVSNLH